GPIIAQGLRRKGPDIAQRHRSKTAAAAVPARADGDVNVQDGRPVQGGAAEFDRSTVAKVLEVKRDFVDTDVGGLHKISKSSSLPQALAGTQVIAAARRQDFMAPFAALGAAVIYQNIAFA